MVCDILLGNKKARGGFYSVAYQASVHWTLNFSWLPLYIYTFLTIRTLSSVLDHVECNYCISCGQSAMSVCGSASEHMLL
jgi:hypothetical protein